MNILKLCFPPPTCKNDSHVWKKNKFIRAGKKKTSSGDVFHCLVLLVLLEVFEKVFSCRNDFVVFFFSLSFSMKENPRRLSKSGS